MSTKPDCSTSTKQQQVQTFDSQPPAYNNISQQYYEPPHSYPSPNPSASVMQEQYQTYQPQQQYPVQQQNQDQPQYAQQQYQVQPQQQQEQFQQPTDYPEGLSTYRRPSQKESRYHYDSNQGIIGNLISAGASSLGISSSSSSGAIDSFLTGRAQRKANKPRGLIGSLRQMSGDYLMNTPISQQERYMQQKNRLKQQQQQQYGDYRS